MRHDAAGRRTGRRPGAVQLEIGERRQVGHDAYVAENGAQTTSGINIGGVGYAGATIEGVRAATWSTSALQHLLINSGVVMRPEFWAVYGQ